MMYFINMEIPELKSKIQQFFNDGLAIIVGSGLSCAEGIPGMPKLAEFLDDSINARCDEKMIKEWSEVAKLLVDEGLEAALLKVEVSEELENIITMYTAECIAQAESNTISEVFAGTRSLKLSKLLPYLLKPKGGLPIITTNYDRLIEVAGEQVGLGIDNMFIGNCAGTLNEKEAAASLLREVKKHKQGVRYRFRDHIKIAKPHGSLGWYLCGGKPLQNMFRTDHDECLVIAPGKSKFRNGYDSPFDSQRERANKLINKASRYLIIGYGFNDDHLETHLKPAIREGKPTIMLTRSLSTNAEALALENKNVIALDHRTDAPQTRAIVEGKSHTLDCNLWDVASFAEGIFNA